MMKRLPIVCGWLFAIGGGRQLHAQAPNPHKLADSIRIHIEAATDIGDRPGIEQGVLLAERALAAFPESAILEHYRAYGLYRAASLALGAQDNDGARKHLDKAREILETLVKRETIPETPALLASVYGLQIAVARVQMIAGMTLGAKSGTQIDKAVAMGPKNPRVWLMKGIGAFNTPSAFGGGMDKAEADLKNALTFFATDKPAAPLPAWGLADAHVWLGQVYAKQHKKDLARAQYDSALALQPKNGWVTYVLKPALDKKE